jgi:hypothetical protein
VNAETIAGDFLLWAAFWMVVLLAVWFAVSEFAQWLKRKP